MKKMSENLLSPGRSPIWLFSNNPVNGREKFLKNLIKHKHRVFGRKNLDFVVYFFDVFKEYHNLLYHDVDLQFNCPHTPICVERHLKKYNVTQNCLIIHDNIRQKCSLKRNKCNLVLTEWHRKNFCSIFTATIDESWIHVKRLVCCESKHLRNHCRILFSINEYRGR